MCTCLQRLPHQHAISASQVAGISGTLLSTCIGLRSLMATPPRVTHTQEAEGQLEEIGENALHNCIMIANNANARVCDEEVVEEHRR